MACKFLKLIESYKVYKGLSYTYLVSEETES